MIIKYIFTDVFTNKIPVNTNHSTENDLRLKNIIPTQQTSEKKKTKNNRWAKKRASQNKKPKFKIITEFSKECFKRVQICDEELKILLKNEKESVYFKSKKFRCEKCVLTFTSQDILGRHESKFHSKVIFIFHVSFFFFFITYEPSLDLDPA